MGHPAGRPIVLTAPLTESIDHAGFFIQMSLASIPEWMEWVIDKKYPTWRDLPITAEGHAGTAPAGLRVLEAVLAREFGPEQVVVCYPEQLPQFVGERTLLLRCPPMTLWAPRSRPVSMRRFSDPRASRSTRSTRDGCSRPFARADRAAPSRSSWAAPAPGRSTRPIRLARLALIRSLRGARKAPRSSTSAGAPSRASRFRPDSTRVVRTTPENSSSLRRGHHSASSR